MRVPLFLRAVRAAQKFGWGLAGRFVRARPGPYALCAEGLSCVTKDACSRRTSHLVQRRESEGRAVGRRTIDQGGIDWSVRPISYTGSSKEVKFNLLPAPPRTWNDLRQMMLLSSNTSQTLGARELFTSCALKTSTLKMTDRRVGEFDRLSRTLSEARGSPGRL